MNGLIGAADRLGARSAEMVARLYRPRPSARPPLGDDHPVEGEVRATAIHPDDAAAVTGRRRLQNEEEAAVRGLWHRAATMTDHPVEGR